MPFLAHLWALPNTLVALLFGIGGAFEIDRKNRVVIVRGGWMARIFGRLGYAGMCVGEVVLCAPGHDLPRDHPRIYAHELVHATQARIFGLLYLPLTLLCYAIGFVRDPHHAHDTSPLEIWADTASGNADRNAFLQKHRTR